MAQGKFTFTTEEGEDKTEEITQFINLTRLDLVAPDRYSMLLVLQLFGRFMSQDANPAKVIDEIRALEGMGSSSQLKPPIQNKYPPLKGLWHKHYLEDGLSSMAINIRNGLKRFSIPFFEQKVREAEEAGEERFLTIEDTEDIKAIVNDAVEGNWRRLAESQSLTGEWLIFAQHEGQNYYLSLGTHDKSQHDYLRQCIDQMCCLEFPFLTAILNEHEVSTVEQGNPVT